MSSNGDLAVSVVIAEDAIVLVASDDNDGDMQAAFCCQVKAKAPKTLVSMGVCQGLARR